jgi:hypothetical protein
MRNGENLCGSAARLFRWVDELAVKGDFDIAFSIPPQPPLLLSPATLPTTTFNTYKMPTRFFNLSREIRDEIYHHL